MKYIIWTKRSQKDISKILKFYKELYGLNKSRKIVANLRKSAEILENTDYDHSRIGSIDEEFSHLKRTYRKLIRNYCKITYRSGLRHSSKPQKESIIRDGFSY